MSCSSASDICRLGKGLITFILPKICIVAVSFSYLFSFEYDELNLLISSLLSSIDTFDFHPLTKVLNFNTINADNLLSANLCERLSNNLSESKT